MSDLNATLDTSTLLSLSRSGHVVDVPVPLIRILHHPDLGRVGDETTEGALLDGPVVVGRREPKFVPSNGPAQALNDPCISRRQLVVTWHADRRAFSVEASVSARRSVFVGRDRQLAAGQLVGPGTPVEIEGRVILWLDVVPLRRRPRAAMGMVGLSGAMRELRRRIDVVAAGASTVLIHGETGVGKELVAQAVHEQSGRAGPFVALNCAAVQTELMGSELFGHVRGAFTGADRDRPGLFEEASGGTVFLDEVGELPPQLQAGLLRVLQERRVRRVGATRDVPVDVMVVAATHRSLPDEVAAGRFRSDLYGRIERPRIDVQPLRARPEDVPLLCAHFLSMEREQRAGSEPLDALFAPATADRPALPASHVSALMSYGWPRNVRELRKWTTEVAMCLLGGEPVPDAPSGHGAATVSSIPAAARDKGRPTAPAPESVPTGTERPSDARLAEILRELGWSPAAAARHLGVARNTIYAWMHEAGIRRANEYSADEIRPVLARNSGDAKRTAAELRVSLRALRLRIRELGL